MSNTTELMGSDHLQVDALLESIFDALLTYDAAFVHGRMDVFWARLAVHIRAEHHQLFPRLLDAARSNAEFEKQEPQLQTTIDHLRNDHDYFMKELAALIKVTRGRMDLDPSELKDRLEAFSARLTAHNNVEESRIYPLADRLLSEGEAAEMQRTIISELENMPPRFKDAEPI